MANQDEKHDPEDDVQIEVGRFTVQSAIQQQKLFLTLRDKITKKVFQSSFTSSELELCGFNANQAAKLESVGLLIQAAQKKEKGCKLDIKIPQIHGDNEGGGVQGIMNSMPELRYAEVIIIRQDNFFGSKSYTLKLGEVTRDAPDVNADMIEDIKEDVNYLREQIDTLTADLSVQAQHRLPKGSIIHWVGVRKNIPKFWQVYQEDDDNKADEEEEDGVVKDIFTYESDFDKNGIIYALGSAYGTQEWLNPSMSGIVEVRTGARMGRVSQPKHFLINRNEGIMCYVTSAEKNWWSIDFKNIRIRPTNYTLRHDAGEQNQDHLRNWQLQGNNEGYGDWVTLIEHKNDESLNEPDATHTWTLANIDRFYRNFRIALTGPTSNGGTCICCSGFEIYGEIKREDDGGKRKDFTLIKIV